MQQEKNHENTQLVLDFSALTGCSGKASPLWQVMQ
jgi:hypothetical protein